MHIQVRDPRGYAYQVTSRNPEVLAQWLFDAISEIAAAASPGLTELIQVSVYPTAPTGEEEALTRWQNWTLQLGPKHREFTERLSDLIDWVKTSP